MSTIIEQTVNDLRDLSHEDKLRTFKYVPATGKVYIYLSAWCETGFDYYIYLLKKLTSSNESSFIGGVLSLLDDTLYRFSFRYCDENGYTKEGYLLIDKSQIVLVG